MNSKLFFHGLAFATVLLAAGCATSEKERYAQPPSLEEQFKKADKNGDGKVSRQEYGALLIDEMAVYFDGNRDGVIDKAEFVALGGSPEAFAKLDKNGNGFLTADEAKANQEAVEILTVAFVGADTNGDGFVTLAEAKAYREKARPYFR